MLLVIASGAAGQDEAPLADVLARVNSPTLDERETATEELGERADELEAELGRSVSAEALTPEQRTRVCEVLRQRYLLSPRAGLGVSFQEPPGDGPTTGVMIMTVVPGFPAANFLRPGDLVVEAEGRPLVNLMRTQADITFRHAILSLDPGDAIRVRVVRAGETLELEIPTGSFADLGNAAQPDMRWLDGAWRLRAERKGLLLSEADRLPSRELGDWKTMYKPRRDVPGLLPGGRPHAEDEAERSVAALARFDEADRMTTRLQLAAAAHLIELDARIVETQRQIRDARRAASGEPPEGKAFQRIQVELNRLEMQLEIAERQRKELSSRAGAFRRDGG